MRRGQDIPLRRGKVRPEVDRGMTERPSAPAARKGAPKEKLRFRRLWIALGALLVLLVIFLSLAPAESVPDLPYCDSDKVKHFLAYACMMLWFGQIYKRRGASLLIASGLVFLGILLEHIQGSTGYRTFEYEDMAANGIGVVSGLCLSRTRLGDLFFIFEGLFSGRGNPPS